MQLIHGDCLEKMLDIPDGSVDMVMSDPPYGSTQCKWDAIIPLEPMWEQLKRVLKPGGVVVMTAQQPFTASLVASNFKWFKHTWVWIKEAGTGHLNAKKYPLKNHEDVCVFCETVPTYNPRMRPGKPYTCKQGKTKSENYGKQTGAVTVNKGNRYPLTTLEFARDKPKVHPTQKPVALMQYLVQTYTNQGDTVLDFCMGSGSTGVAAQSLRRKFIGIERDEKYYEIAKDRIYATGWGTALNDSERATHTDRVGIE